MTDEELNAIEEGHYPSRRGACIVCSDIETDFPCAVLNLLAEVRRLRKLSEPFRVQVSGR